MVNPPMRYLFWLAFLSLALSGCRAKQDSDDQSGQSISGTLDELQGEWQMLTLWGDNQWVIYRPCDAENRMIHVRSDTVVIGWGQDASIGLIRSFYRDDEGRTVIEAVDLDMDERVTYACRFEDAAHKLARWWLFEDQSSDLFAHSDIANSYHAYEQPCSECWDDCEDQ
jgi:hypothetical protein